MKKVLNIVPYAYLPYFSGGQKLIAHFNHYLGEQCILHVVGTSDNVTDLVEAYTLHSTLRKSRFRYADIGAFFRIKEIIRSEKIDTIIIEHPYLGWLGCLLKAFCNKKLIVHTHNIEYERFRTLGKRWWPFLKLYEQIVLRIADQIFCISEDDKLTMVSEMNLQASKCVVVPYGITQKQAPADKKKSKLLICSKHQLDPQVPLFLFNGLLDYKPNLDALMVILEKIAPLLQQKKIRYNILITGKRLPAELNELNAWRAQHIFYAGFVNDIDLYFKGADLFLNPVQSGGGIKTKMIEALGMNTPVVSTITGAKGVNKDVCGKMLKTVEDNNWIQFTESILASLKETETIPSDFYNTYHWDAIADNALKYCVTKSSHDLFC